MARLTSTAAQVLTLTSLVIASGIAATTGASAGPFCTNPNVPCVPTPSYNLPPKLIVVKPSSGPVQLKPHYGADQGFNHGPVGGGGQYGHGGPGWGLGAAVAGGMVVGALAATAASHGSYAGGDCYVERRRVYDDYGNVFIRRIRVCE